MSELVIICDACKKENDRHSVFCEDCAQPINHILPVEKVPVLKQLGGSSQNTTPNKNCPKCGAIPSPSFRLTCDTCGVRFVVQGGVVGESASHVASISTIGSSEEVSPPIRGSLFLCFGNKRFELKEGDVLGREGTVAVSDFAVFDTVSRMHACINYVGEVWHIQRLSKNITEVDGKALDKGELHALNQGSNSVRLSSKCEITLEVK